MAKYLVGHSERIQLTEELKRCRVTLGSAERIKEILDRLDTLDRFEQVAQEMMSKKP